MNPSRGRVAVVTGGARRIGAAIARELARRGFAVGITWRTSRREATSLVREVGGFAFRLDLARPGSVRNFTAAVAGRMGRVDLLVHNAAVFPRTPMATVSPGAWDGIFAVNLRGPFLLTRAMLPLLQAAPGGGAVLFLGDAGAGGLWPAYLPYCLSKIALERQAAAWKAMLEPGTRVGIVKPGLALMPEGFPKREWERLRARGRPRGPDSPEKIAEAVLRFARGRRYTSS